MGDEKIVFTNKTPLTRDTLQKLSSIEYISVLATGYNVVDANESVNVVNK